MNIYGLSTKERYFDDSIRGYIRHFRILWQKENMPHTNFFFPFATANERKNERMNEGTKERANEHFMIPTYVTFLQTHISSIRSKR